VIYLDSCIVIYVAEDGSARGERLRARLADLDDEVVAISPLVMLECLVGPFRDENLLLSDRYERLFEQFHLVDIDVHAYRRAAELRARHGIRTPDALHVAAAQLGGCRALWTNDTRLAKHTHGFAVDALS
jgi:predicted nucleic acid-binding protein